MGEEQVFERQSKRGPVAGGGESGRVGGGADMG